MLHQKHEFDILNESYDDDVWRVFTFTFFGYVIINMSIEDMFYVFSSPIHLSIFKYTLNMHKSPQQILLAIQATLRIHFRMVDSF